jgi:hypothetical protein
MAYALLDHLRRSRTLSSVAALVIVVSIAIMAGPAQAQLISQGGTQASALDVNALAKATGGGTVISQSAGNAVASFGFNARRPVGFAGGGTAEGRLNYDVHKNVTNRHVNAPVTQMEASPTPQPPNQTGGDALLLADCTPPASCPTGTDYVLAYVDDNADSGGGQDIFQIYLCQGPAGFPGTFIPGTPIGACSTGPDGGLLRSGNIQVRGDAGVAGEMIATAAGSGAYTSTPNVNGVELSGGTFGIGMRTAGPGDLEANLSGVQPLLGLFQQLTVSGWITSASVNGGTMTFSGTASLDMGDGSAALTGLPLSGSVTASGLTLTVGSWSFGTLPKQDGFIAIE